jgi:hypothetical protein
MFVITEFVCTGKLRYMRTFYLRILVYAICKKGHNSLCGNILNLLPPVYAILNIISAQNNQIKKFHYNVKNNMEPNQPIAICYLDKILTILKSN